MMLPVYPSLDSVTSFSIPGTSNFSCRSLFLLLSSSALVSVDCNQNKAPVLSWLWVSQQGETPFAHHENVLVSVAPFPPISPWPVFSGTTSQRHSKVFFWRNALKQPLVIAPVQRPHDCSARLYCSLAPTSWVTLSKLQRDQLSCLVRDKLIFLGQAAFSSGQYVHGWPSQASWSTLARRGKL